MLRFLFVVGQLLILGIQLDAEPLPYGSGSVDCCNTLCCCPQCTKPCEFNGCSCELCKRSEWTVLVRALRKMKSAFPNGVPQLPAAGYPTPPPCPPLPCPSSTTTTTTTTSTTPSTSTATETTKSPPSLPCPTLPPQTPCEPPPYPVYPPAYPYPYETTAEPYVDPDFWSSVWYFFTHGWGIVAFIALILFWLALCLCCLVALAIWATGQSRRTYVVNPPAPAHNVTVNASPPESRV